MRKFNITVNGVAYEVEVEEVGAVQSAAPVAPVAPAAAPVAAPKAAPAAQKAAAPITSGLKITAPMPGNILSVKTTAGTKIKKGDVLLVLEAMKMENEIVAPQDGTVAQVAVSKGATVNSGDVLVVLG